jgi:hypothetical protein
MRRLGGFEVTHFEGVHAYPLPTGLPRVARLAQAGRARLKALLCHQWPAMFAYQFIMVGRKISR